MISKLICLEIEYKGTAVAQWLRCCATNRKVAGSIPDGVIGIFRWHNSSDRTMALGSTQPLTEMSTRRISWGKCGRCVRLTTLPPPCAVFVKSGNLNFLEPSGPLQACNGTDLTDTYLTKQSKIMHYAALWGLAFSTVNTSSHCRDIALILPQTLASYV